jgi:hypothetical protein
MGPQIGLDLDNAAYAFSLGEAVDDQLAQQLAGDLGRVAVVKIPGQRA